METFSENLVAGVRYIMSIITDFATMDFPGTSLPFILIPIGVWGIYFVWKYILGNMFDVEWKK